jgi:hypothetical protein
MNLAERHGATICDSTYVLTPIVKNNYVVGVKAKKNDREINFYGKNDR